MPQIDIASRVIEFFFFEKESRAHRRSP